MYNWLKHKISAIIAEAVLIEAPSFLYFLTQFITVAGVCTFFSGFFWVILTLWSKITAPLAKWLV